MTTFREYQNQIEELQKKAAAARKEELSTTIRDIKKKIAEFGLTAADLGFAPAPAPRRGPRGAAKAAASAVGKTDKRKRRASASSGKKVPPKYQGGPGEFWTGRGRQPAWVVAALAAGRTLDDLRIK